MKKNIIHQYFKQQFEGITVLVQVDPETFRGMEITIHEGGKMEKRKMQFDDQIFEDLSHDGFKASSALEFNLYLKGLSKGD